MRRTFSKSSKQKITAMGLAVMMTAQSPAMAAEIETSQTENTVVTQEDSQEEATVAEDVSAAEQETVTEQETVSEQDSVMVQETASEENAIEEVSTEIVTEETDNEESVSSEDISVLETKISEIEDVTIEEIAETIEEETIEEETEDLTTEDVIEEQNLAATQSAFAEGWTLHDDGTYTYVQNGIQLKNCVAMVDGSYYGFDESGIMFANGIFSMVEDGVWNYYYASENGSLYVNQWVEVPNMLDGSAWYYFGDGGRAYKSGIYNVNGTDYYFSHNGKMATSSVCIQNDIYYIADENGYLTQAPKTGWVLIGKNYYYMQDGAMKKDCVAQIAGKYYKFNYAGILYMDCIGDDYRAKADGSLYINEWAGGSGQENNLDNDLYDNSSWRYYGADGKPYKNGFYEINNTTYYFDNFGIMVQNKVICKDGVYYIFDQNGAQIKNPGWNLQEGKWYYVKEDGTLYLGVLTDNGHNYYLTPEMVISKDFIKINDICYKIDSNGYMTMLTDGFYNEKTTKKSSDSDDSMRIYYISNGNISDSGWKEIDGKKYYFKETNIERDGVWTKENVALRKGLYEIDGKKYYFNSEGAVETNGWILDENGNWYYAKTSGEIVTGDLLINGTQYHFNENGTLKTGLIMENGVGKFYGEDGSVAEVINHDGWNLVNGIYYYLEAGTLLKGTDRYWENGQEKKAGTYKLSDGNWYVFDEEGRMLNNVMIFDRWYGEYGAAMTGWIYQAGNWYYADPENAKLYTGFHVVNGVKYYFAPEMVTGEIVVGSKVITTDDNGVVTNVKHIENGWSCHNGVWYYYMNGEPYTGVVGKYWVVDGKMKEDVLLEPNTWTGNGSYYTKEDGKMAWFEWVKIDEKWYYFTTSGLAGGNTKNTDPLYKEGKTYLFDDDGAYIPAEDYPQGWSMIGENWYYKDGENFVTGTVKQINGDWYVFNFHGKMITGFANAESYSFGGKQYYDGGAYYYGSDGRRCYYTGWQMLEGNWYYFNNYSEAASGWKMINGMKYYFDTEDHYMYTGYHAINGELYYFNADGSCWGKCGPQSGWYQAEGKWYFMKGGYVTTGSAYINGITYQFDDDGVMQE